MKYKRYSYSVIYQVLNLKINEYDWEYKFFSSKKLSKEFAKSILKENSNNGVQIKRDTEYYNFSTKNWDRSENENDEILVMENTKEDYKKVLGITLC